MRASFALLAVVCPSRMLDSISQSVVSLAVVPQHAERHQTFRCLQMSKWIVFSGRPKAMQVLLAGAMALGLCLAGAVTHAQVVQRSQVTDPTQGYAPQVTVTGIVNETRTGQAPMV